MANVAKRFALSEQSVSNTLHARGVRIRSPSAGGQRALSEAVVRPDGQEKGRGADDEQRLAKANMEWEIQARERVWPVPGVYALYQRGELKYIGQSRDCADRIHHHRHHGLGQRSRRPEGRAWLEAKPGWEKGMDFTARVLPTPQLTGGRGTDDERERKRLERYWIARLRPPCNMQGLPR